MPKLRTANPFGTTAAINASVSRLRNQGYDSSAIIEYVRDTFPGVNRKTAAALVNKHLEAMNRADEFMDKNLGEFSNLAKKYNCPGGVYLSMSFQFNRQDTGEAKRYFDVVRVDTSASGNRVRDTIMQGIEAILEAASNNNYEVPKRLGESLDQMIERGKVRISAIDC